MSPGAGILDGARYARGRAAGKGKIFADRLADDLGASVEQPCDDGSIELRDITFQHGRAVSERNAGKGVGVFDRDLFAREFAAARAFDMGLCDPRAVFVLFTLRPVIRAARICDLGYI